MGPARLSLHPAASYLQAIGRRGAETAPAARGFRLSPHPRAAAPPAAVRAAALLGGSLAPGPAAPFRAPAGSRSAAARPRGAVDRPRRGGAERGVGQACGAGTQHRGSGERAGGCGLGFEPGQLLGACAPGAQEGGAELPWPRGATGPRPRDRPRPAPPRPVPLRACVRAPSNGVWKKLRGAEGSAIPGFEKRQNRHGSERSITHGAPSKPPK